MTKKLFAAYSAGTALIALAVIHRTVEPGKSGNKLAGIAPVAPKILEITPGTLFTPKDETEYNEIMFAKAARLPDERDNLNKIDRLEEFFPEEEGNDDLEGERQRARDKIAAAASARKAKAAEEAETARLAEEAEAQRVAEEEEAAAQKKADEEAAAAKAADEAAAEAQRVADEEAAAEKAAAEKAAADKKKAPVKKPAKATDQDEDESVV